jgi:hypothetical protein
MKFCIAFMFQNERPWLELHLPRWMDATPEIDGIVAVDGGSTDGGGAYVQEWVDWVGGTVIERPWDWKPLDQENALIAAAESAGFDAMLLTAPDELWHPQHIRQIKRLLEEGHIMLQFPTYNFVKDRRHYAPHAPYYPDLHQRAWPLNQGVRHVGVLDSVPNVHHSQFTLLEHIHLYHYGHIKPRDWYTLKHVNFYRAKDGLPALAELPEDHPIMPFPEHIPFGGLQPLDPAKIGDRAPLE